MVPNLSKGAGIKGTALYVLHDVRDEGERALGADLTPDQQSTARVAMTATRNLSTDDPELAWRLMCATAENREALKEAAGVHKGGRPSKYQCGHISLSWEHETKPDRAEMLRAAEGALTSLGWEKLQALIVEHRDHDHAHCHIVVNLIDPETGRTAPNAKNDYEKLQRWAHQYDRDRGIEVCPNRAARMEREPDDPTPSAPAARWLSRKEYETVRAAERAEQRTQALDRYREAAAAVREQFRPEWAALYGEQRGELRALDQVQRATMRELASAAKVRTARVGDAGEKGWMGPGVSVRTRMAEFVNEHRADIWRGVDATNQPGNQQTMLSPVYVKRALERAHAAGRAALVEQHEAAKGELQGRHTEARQDAYRQAWQRPQEAAVLPLPAKDAEPAPSTREGGKVGLAAALAITAAGIAAYTLQRGRGSGEGRSVDPERDLAAAAERIQRRTTHAANSNRPATVRPPEDPAPPNSAKDPQGGLADKMAAMEHHRAAERAAYRARFDPERHREHHRERRRD